MSLYWPKQAAGMEPAGQAGVGSSPQGGALYRGCSLKFRVCAGGAAHSWAANTGRGCHNRALVSLMTEPGASKEEGDPEWVTLEKFHLSEGTVCISTWTPQCLGTPHEGQGLEFNLTRHTLSP